MSSDSNVKDRYMSDGREKSVNVLYVYNKVV